MSTGFASTVPDIKLPGVSGWPTPQEPPKYAKSGPKPMGIPDGAKTMVDTFSKSNDEGKTEKVPLQLGKVIGCVVAGAALLTAVYKGGAIVDWAKNLFKKS